MKKGLHIFNLANKSIKGWFPTSKSNGNLYIPFVSTVEEKFLYYVEYSHNILNIERADINDTFSDVYKLKRNNLVPLSIPYSIEEKNHTYYPDFILTLKGGRTIIAEIGVKELKKSKQSLCKARAAIDYCDEKGWEYWFVFDENILSKTHYDNLILLKSYDKTMYQNQEIKNEILAVIQSNALISISDIVKYISKKHSEKEVEMCGYEFINNLVKEGKIKFDFENKEFKRTSVFSVTSQSESLLLSKDIHVPYDEILEMYNNVNIDDDSKNNEINDITSYVDSSLLDDKITEEFLNRRAAVLEAISVNRNLSITQIAKNHNLSRTNLYSLINKYLQYGELALLPYWKYDGPKTFIREDIVEVIKKIYNKKPNWTAMQIYESDDLKKAITKLSKQTNTLIHLPSYHQIYRFLNKLKQDSDLLISRPRKNSSKEKMTTLGQWVRSIGSPMDQVQVDAHWIDIKIVTSDKEDVAGRIWAIVLIDVKTANVLGYSFSLKAPIEEDYMTALKCCMESKNIITKNYNCNNDWPSTGIPRKVLSDNGKIFISKRSTDVLVKRFGIVEEIAPPYAPDVKGTIEALFTWVVRRLASRLPGYTKDRDSKELEKEVLKAGITLDDFEELFVRSIVDGYNQEWDDLRGHTRYNLWVSEEKANKLILPQWLGTKDELKLLLMKEEKSRKINRRGISFNGRWYQNITMMKSIVNQSVNIRYDKRDISVIYIYLDNGTYYCEAYCQELMGNRSSIWEDKVLKQNINKIKDIHNKKARASTNNNISSIKRDKKSTLKEKEAQFLEQQKLYDNQDIHTKKVNDILLQNRLNQDLNEIIEVKSDVFKFDKSSLKKLEVRKL